MSELGPNRSGTRFEGWSRTGGNTTAGLGPPQFLCNGLGIGKIHELYFLFWVGKNCPSTRPVMQACKRALSSATRPGTSPDWNRLNGNTATYWVLCYVLGVMGVVLSIGFGFFYRCTVDISVGWIPAIKFDSDSNSDSGKKSNPTPIRGRKTDSDSDSDSGQTLIIVTKFCHSQSDINGGNFTESFRNFPEQSSRNFPKVSDSIRTWKRGKFRKFSKNSKFLICTSVFKIMIKRISADILALFTIFGKFPKVSAYFQSFRNFTLKKYFLKVSETFGKFPAISIFPEILHHYGHSSSNLF